MSDPKPHTIADEAIDDEQDEIGLAEDLAAYLTPDGKVDLKKVIANAESLEIPDDLDDEHEPA